MTTPPTPIPAPPPATAAAAPAGFDLGETDRLLTTTRAVRKRLDLGRPVEREVLLDCLRIATQAPSGGNTQPWRWLVVDDPEIRAGLADIYRKGYGPYIEMQKAAVVAPGATRTAPSCAAPTTWPSTCTRCRST